MMSHNPFTYIKHNMFKFKLTGYVGLGISIYILYICQLQLKRSNHLLLHIIDRIDRIDHDIVTKPISDNDDIVVTKPISDNDDIVVTKPISCNDDNGYDII